MDFLDDSKKDQFLDRVDLVEEPSEPSWSEKFDRFFIRRVTISLKEKAYFFHLMSVLFDSGVSVISALQILSRRIRSVRFRGILHTMFSDINSGKSLSEAMTRFPSVFSEGEIEVTRSGEVSGTLDKMFARLSAQANEAYDLRLKVRSAVTYPIVVLFVLFFSIAVVMIFVVPRISEFFINYNAPLPLLTRVLIAVSSFFSSYWWMLSMLILFFFMAFRWYISTEDGRFHWDYFVLKIPMIGNFQRDLVLGRLLRLLSLLIASGIPLIATTEILMRSSGNDVYRRKFARVLSDIRQGKRFSTSLSESSFLFPDMVSVVLDIGERAGSLEASAEKLSHHYDQEVIHSLYEMTALLEPLIILVVGGGVLLLALAILSPIFSLSTLV